MAWPAAMQQARRDFVEHRLLGVKSLCFWLLGSTVYFRSTSLQEIASHPVEWPNDTLLGRGPCKVEIASWRALKSMRSHNSFRWPLYPSSRASQRGVARLELGWFVQKCW